MMYVFFSCSVGSVLGGVGTCWNCSNHFGVCLEVLPGDDSLRPLLHIVSAVTRTIKVLFILSSMCTLEKFRSTKDPLLCDEFSHLFDNIVKYPIRVSYRIRRLGIFRVRVIFVAEHTNKR